MAAQLAILGLSFIFALQSHAALGSSKRVSEEVPPESTRKEIQGKSYKYDSYLTFNEMEERVEYLRRSSPEVSVRVMGKSREGRKIYLLTVTSVGPRSAGDLTDHLQGGKGHQGHEGSDLVGSGGDNGTVVEVEEEEVEGRRWRTVRQGRVRTAGQKPVVFVDGGIHAREWVTPAAAFYLVDRLLESPHLIRDLEWRVMPMVNPDGYSYTQTERMWRKNRAKNRGSRCVGVDLNRNFDIHWEETNQNPCSDTYSGTKPFSEPESRAVRDAVREVRSRVQAYVTLHTYGQLFLYPFGYTDKKAPGNVEKLKSVGRGMAKAVHDHYGNEYLVRQASAIGAAAGGSDDWALVKMKIPLSFTFELQGKVGQPFLFTRSGFKLSGHKLPQAVDECWLALEYLGDLILSEQGLRMTADEKAATRHPDEPSHPGLYPVGWSQVVQQVQRIQAELKAKSSMDVKSEVGQGGPLRSRAELSHGCARRGNLFVCPHMVFWGSMFNAAVRRAS